MISFDLFDTMRHVGKLFFLFVPICKGRAALKEWKIMCRVTQILSEKIKSSV